MNRSWNNQESNLCVQVIMVGLDSAGKSTLLAQLLTGKVGFF